MHGVQLFIQSRVVGLHALNLHNLVRFFGIGHGLGAVLGGRGVFLGAGPEREERGKTEQQQDENAAEFIEIIAHYHSISFTTQTTSAATIVQSMKSQNENTAPYMSILICKNFAISVITATNISICPFRPRL